MIDVESQIYTPIAEALRAQFPGICTPRISGVLLCPRFPIWRTQQSTVWLPDTRQKRTEPLFIGGK